MRIHAPKKLVASFVVIVAGVTFGFAAALWTANGSGSGNAKAVALPVTVTVNAVTGAADLYPGFTQGDVYFTMTNTNTRAMTFTSMTPGLVTPSNPVTCPATNVTLASASGLNLQVAANATSPTVSVTDVVSMASSAPDGCAGQTFTIALTLTGTQDA